MKKLEIDKIAKMIMLRGVGYQQAEIAEELEVSPAAISYQLKRLRKLSKEYSPKDIFDYYIKGLKLMEEKMSKFRR